MGPLPALVPMEVSTRLGRLRDLLPAAGCVALVVSDLTNVRYLTGFTGSNAVLVVLPDDTVLVTDGRYRDQAADQLGGAGVSARIEVAPDPGPVLAATLRGVTTVGLEAHAVAWEVVRRYEYDVLPWARLVPTTGLVAGLRAVKDPGEVARLRRASAIADEALGEVRHRLDDGVTERTFAHELEDAMRGRGSEAPSFATIVGSGPNGAKPHARPTDRVIGAEGGDLVVVDFGATVDGYHSDMTRTYAVGEVTATQQRMFDVVRAAQADGVAAVAPGVACVDVDAACRSVIDAAGWGDAFVHGTGHGIGLVIHEDPRVSRQSTAVLATGHCVTVEPGVYLAGNGGVRIEDSVVVTPGGCDLLTHAPYT